MQARYRSDYAGEFVVTETVWSGGRKQQQREFIANPIENHHISGRAACIGSAVDQDQFDHSILQRHRGGLLSSKKLQTYGVGTITNHMRLDFAVETDPDKLGNLIFSDYHNQNIVYTSAKLCLQNPGQCYLIPFNPRMLDIATIVYLAAFDGHREIFMLGYHKDTPDVPTDWYLQIKQITDAYATTKFYFVGEPTNMFEQWFENANCQPMKHRDFIGYCDV